ncbi:MAG: 4a-hydroxytetrahydrobiopterin dehydratase [Gammaproteobacteria bacterium]
MSELANRHCRRPEKSDQPLARDRARHLLSQVHGDWSLAQEGDRIQRTFEFRNFYETIGFVNALAWIVNTEDHHPDLEVSYKRCVVRFSTHAVGGLSENDFICAAKTDALVA